MKQADRSLGTLRILPRPCRKQLTSEMTVVAYDEREDTPRRAEAAWQCSMLKFRLMKFQKGKEQELDSVLQGLLLAAELRHTEAGGIVGWLHAAFGRPLPVSTEEEKKWLYAAVCMGSSTARRRLLSLDMEEYKRAVAHLGSRYLGIGFVVPQNYYDSDLADDWDFFANLDNSPSSLGDIFQLAATGGRYDLIRRIITLRAHDLDINELFIANETALLKACRSGHVRIALLLLENGADPTLANDEGATPLHFLSSFEDENIPEVTDALIRAGADPEARSHGGWRYKRCIDSTYGSVEGTPLTWAVAAGNETATQALIDIGADPFDVKGRDVQYEDGWSNSVHVSPVWQAAVTCRYRLLEILLEPSKDYAEHLNRAGRKIGSHGLKDDMALLGWVVTDGDSSTSTWMLIHGGDYGEAFKKTFELLISHGANPLHVTGKGDSVIEIAVSHPQPYIVDFLLGWQNGRLITNTLKWLRCIWTTCMNKDKAAFDLLVNHSQADRVTPEQWNAVFTRAHALPDDTEFLSHLDQFRRSSTDMNTQFEDSLIAGKYILARWIYESGRCELTRMTNGQTILGRLIMSSRSYSSYGGHIEAFLDMNVPDEIYYNVIELDGSIMSALHVAVFMVEYRPGSVRSLSPLQSILKRKYEPDYLNLAILDGVHKGCTAMHIAVKTCNEEAVRYLLDEEGDCLDLSLLDKNGDSLIDLASYLFKNQAAQMEAWEVPKEMRRKADERHFENSLMILHMLYDTKRAKPRKLLASVTKIDTDELFIILYEAQQFRPMKVNPSSTSSLLQSFFVTRLTDFSVQWLVAGTNCTPRCNVLIESRLGFNHDLASDCDEGPRSPAQ